MDDQKQVEEQRKRAAEDMDERCRRIAAWMQSETYPMKPDNPLLNASDDDVKAYIRKRREEFMAPGGKWEKYQAEQAEKAKQQTVAKERK
jgi:hypothetical protein